MEQRLTIITLAVKDVYLATAFYEDCFGWEKTADSNANISFFNLNGILLALYERSALAEDANTTPAGEGFPSFTLAHNTRSEAEVDQLVSSLRAKGATVQKEAQRVEWGGYSAYVKDLDGYLWEIAFNPFLSLDHKGMVGQE
jgi:predicted lactoylglutathione lyase